MQAEVTDARRKVYAKSGIAQKMALVTSWLMNAEHVRVMLMSLAKTADFAPENYEALAEIDIATMEAGDERLSSQSSVSGSMPSRTKAETVLEAANEHVPVLA